ncbi:MAG: hypothetical protein ACLTR6_16085 [Clostridium fessum]
MIPYLQTARDAVTDINSNTQALSNTMEDMQDELIACMTAWEV